MNFFAIPLSCIFLIALSVNATADTLSCDADGIPVACKVVSRGAVSGPDHCRNSISKNRCYVDVEYSNERRQRILGDACVVWDSDCATGSKHAMTPDCARYIDLE